MVQVIKAKKCYFLEEIDLMFISPKEMEDYYKDLLVINGVKFTPRQIDVISCMANARVRHQQISDILGIKITVVEAHISDIRKRMRQNPGIGNDIVPFIEQASNYKAVKEHYQYLLHQYEFENLLKRISRVRSHDQYEVVEIYYIHDKNSNLVIGSSKKIGLIKHLSLLGLSVISVDLSKANENNSKSNLDSKNSKKTDSHKIFILSDALITKIQSDNKLQTVIKNLIGISEEEGVSEKLRNTNHIGSQNIFAFSLEKQLPANVSTMFQNATIISIRDNYYFSFLDFLERSKFIIDKKVSSEILKFRENYNEPIQYLAQSMYGSDAEKGNLEGISRITHYKHFKLLSYITALFFLLVLLITYNKLFTLSNKSYNFGAVQHESFTNKEQITIENIESIIEDLAIHFTTKSMFPEHRKKNEEYRHKVEQMINEVKNNAQIQEYMSSQISPYYLMSYISCIQSIAVYYLYNYHDGEKAREELFFAKDIVEKYINNRSKIKINFSNLITEKKYGAIYSELSLVENLPEMYTKILYQIGKAFLFPVSPKYLPKSKKYFECVKYLGYKLNTFEGYMSEENGLGIIFTIEIENDIKSGNFEDVRGKLLKLIELYRRLKNDKKQYISNYKPQSYQKYKGRKLSTDYFTKTKDTHLGLKKDFFEIITPSENLHLQIECTMRLVNAYVLLLQITKQDKIFDKINVGDENKINQESKIKKSYIKAISEQFLDNKRDEGLLEQAKYQEVPPKTKAKIYNCLGNALLILETLENSKTRDVIDMVDKIKQFRLKIKDKLKIIDDFPGNDVASPETNLFVFSSKKIANTGTKLGGQIEDRIVSLELIYKIFKEAEGYSRETDFTKADANHGMAKTLGRYLRIYDDSKIEEVKRKNIEKQIKVHESTRDRINKVLKREQTN